MCLYIFCINVLYIYMHIYMYSKINFKIENIFYSAKVNRLVCMSGKIPIQFNWGAPSGCMGRTKLC